MDRTSKRAALITGALSLLAVGAWVWVIYNRNRVDADYELDLVSSAPAGLRVTANLRSDVRAFYDGRDLSPVWIDESGVTPKAIAAIAVLDQAVEHGLIPDSYSASILRQTHRELAGSNTEGSGAAAQHDALMQFEVRLTGALLALGHDVSVGRTSPADLDARWQALRTPPSLPRTLAAAINGDLSDWLTVIQPQHAQYAALKRALTNREQLDAAGLPDAAATVAANMERWRWMPDTLGERYLFVNIPSYTLIAREGEQVALTMRVVVGKPVTNQTPVLSSEISSVVFSPTWGIPTSIVANETVPAILKDRNYLTKQKIDAFRMTSTGLVSVDQATVASSSAAELRQLIYRQRSGNSNALGLAKFPFPNTYDVYLHDTPSDSAFLRSARALSHGCVRLEHPEALANYLLNGDRGWTTARVDKAMHSGKQQYVKLPASIPVHLAYFTAIVDADGKMQLFKDIYGYDRALTIDASE